jgi:two-component system NarL family sensor kinase
VLDQLWGPGLVLLFVVILLFPDGRVPSPFWRAALWVFGAVYAVLEVATAVAIAGAIAAHPLRVDVNGGLATVDTPAGWYSLVQGPAILVLIVLSLCFVGRQALSWRRASSDRRQQLKWLASGAAVTLVCGAVSGTFSSSGTTILSVVGNYAWFGWAALPVSIGVAILRYRLYDITAAAAGAAGGGPAVQPGPLRRRQDRGRIRGAAEGRARPGRGPR